VWEQHRLLPPHQASLGHRLLHLPAMEELLRERCLLVGHLQGRPERVIGMGLQRLLALLENALQPGQVVSRVARGPLVVRPGAWLWGPVGSRLRSSFGVCPC